MKKITVKLILAILLFSDVAYAKTYKQEAVKVEDGIGMVTGAPTGTYIAFGNDIAKVAGLEGQKIIVKPSKGSIDNIRRMTDKENAGLGIVQSDVLGILRRTNNQNSIAIAKQLRMVFPFYQEEVHILARGNILSLKDLNGKRVAIGQAGSGNMLTSVNLFALAGIRPAKMLQIAPPEGVVAVLAGDVDAAVFIGGKPVSLFKNLESVRTMQAGKNAALLDDIHFVKIDDANVLKEYNKAEISSKDYSFVKQPVATVAVTAILVAYDFSASNSSYFSKRCAELKNIGASIQKHLADLQASGHPKWKEVDPLRQVALWERDKCALSGISTAETNPLEQDLLGIVQKKHAN